MVASAPSFRTQRITRSGCSTPGADAFYGSRAFRTPNIADEGNREARPIRVMDPLIELHGKPQELVQQRRIAIRCVRHKSVGEQTSSY